MTDFNNPIDKDKTTENPGLIPYAHHVGSALIKPDNTDGFKSKGIARVNREMSDRMQKIKEEYEKIMEELNWNDIIYNSQMGFEPLIGEEYYLYERDNGEKYLSLINPDSWNKKHIGTFRLNSDYKWEKL